MCGNPDYQCQLYFGSSAVSAPRQCYELINSKGDRFGNCGHPTSSNPAYVQCRDENIFCGKIVCQDVETLPEIQPLHTLIQISNGGKFCWSMDAYNVTDIPDDGDVHHGISCAPQKVCMNYSCTDYAALNYDCDPARMCSGRGVCNNLRHCHCEAGYAPPDCKTIGNGGSVDSGPPGKPDDENLSEDEWKSHGIGHGNLGRGGENRDESRTIGKLVYVFPLFLFGIFLALIIGTSFGAGKGFSQCSQEALEETEEAAVQEEEGGIREEKNEAENESDRKMPSIANLDT